MLADVSKYEVTVLNASRLITDFDNENLPNEERKVAYFRVQYLWYHRWFYRIIYTSVKSNASWLLRKFDNIDYQHEKNNRYVEITMLSGDGSEIEFETNSFIVLSLMV